MQELDDYEIRYEEHGEARQPRWRTPLGRQRSLRRSCIGFRPGLDVFALINSHGVNRLHRSQSRRWGAQSFVCHGAEDFLARRGALTTNQE